MTEVGSSAPFPARLLDWAGHKAGGVRRLFDEESGRPGAVVFKTNLLDRLEEWTVDYARGVKGTPRIILLVGGPGNGKTEAIESTVRWLDGALGLDSGLVDLLRQAFSPSDGLVPRVVKIDLDTLPSAAAWGFLSIVQDASVVTDGTRAASQMLLDELSSATRAGGAYLCCVNRGVLDDALIEAIDTGDENARRLLEAVARAVGLFPNAPPCWPLPGFPDVAVWPMDVESLLVAPAKGGPSPASALFEIALDPAMWAATDACAAGPACPFCHSRRLLSHERELSSVLKILRWHEVASGKRWSFRDLFSVVSYLLAGNHGSAIDEGIDPCRWAARLVEQDDIARRGGKVSRQTSSALFQLVAAQYQHALFHRFDREAGPSLLRDLKELGLADHNTAMGLHWFLASRRIKYLPAMIAPSLEGVVDIMDPALADPDTEVRATQRTTWWLRDIDARFSRSVAEGLDYVRKAQVLSRIELELLERLAALDTLLSSSAIRRKRPQAASRVQRLARDFACRLVRRTLGTRTATVLDAGILADFQAVVEDDAGSDLYDVAREVEKLLNTNQDFEISLTTTFGQPLPPPMQRATLVVPARQVKPLDEDPVARPRNPIAFLQVGRGKSSQPIALTYDLFKAVRELERGMSIASLPRTVLALLDTAKARLSGPIVRDRDILDRAIIRIGSGGVVVEERRKGFAARREGPSR
ncbi:hypothetical protein [Rhizobium leguminosarum]|uniref:hypothetical protein n=1 Tax=Rhizobium leguminosarum TaxID=384 RepID=UPI001440F94D|nr:hypothetical protein [Rhizobium leguminosarum]MBY5867835.1 hypothetical protein [Rhizobium leguminosarum]NKM06472.1 hypothetical protein [Rhizobium leguminosarum bv. viciae]